MPRYDYLCEANGEVIEIAHPMDDVILTWGDLCERSGNPLNGTPTDSAVRKIITGGNVINSKSLGSGQAPPCETTGVCCGGNACGLN